MSEVKQRVGLGVARDDQARYASLLAWGSRAGLAVLVGSFLLYVAEVVPPLVPHEELPELWSASAADFLERAGISTGWHWTQFVHHGDIMNLVGIALLAFCSVPCLLAVMPIYWSSHQRALFAVCALELAVLMLAASGLVVFH